MRILIADDDLTTRTLLKAKLGQMGYQITLACDGKEAWEIMQRENAPPLALLDWMMPGMDGVEICRRLRETPTQTPPYLILLTAKENKQDIVTGLLAGANDYIVKTFDLAELHARMKVGERVIGLQRDVAGYVAEQQNAIDALMESERFVRSTLDALPSHIAITDHAGWIIALNRSWLSFLEQDPPPVQQVAVGMNYLELCDSIGVDAFGEASVLASGIRMVLKKEREHFTMEYSCHTPREQRWFLARVTRFHGDNPVRAIIVHENITELKLAQCRIQHLAFHDPLTNLPNRLLMLDHLERALARADRDDNIVALIFVDLDNFKMINDTLGHPSGDKLLRAVASRLEELVRRTDIVARLGGDEFVVILVGARQPGDIVRAVQKLNESLAEPVDIDGRQVFITASVGIAIYPFDSHDVNTLLKHADIAMYHAKSLGKNTCCFFSTEMNEQNQQRLNLETSLRGALDRNEFILHYQPWVSIETGLITGMEALLRWEHPDLGLIMPDVFIPLAEETGLIIPIGEWVLKTACMQIKALHDAGFTELRVAVNLSSRQLRYNRLAEMVAKAVSQSGVAPECLELELTESSIMEKTEDATRALHAIRALGITIAIDDFGTGYSSLNYLKRFPIQKLKIDRSFIRDLPSDADDIAITRAIIAMARSLNLNVTAEGVETAEQFYFMKTHQCDDVQGFLVSRPVPGEELLPLLQRNLSAVKLPRRSTGRHTRA